MQTPRCLARWNVTSAYSWKHPGREYHVSYAMVGDRIAWDAWFGSTTRTTVAELIDGGLESAEAAVDACKRHAEGQV